MNCNDAIERLPWLLNGTLDDEERRQVLEHAAGCPACKAALSDTREAWQVFAQHIPAADLVAYAAGETPDGTGRELLEEHLASCPQCAAELELVRTSRGLAEDDGVALFVPLPQPAARPAAAAPAGNLRRWRSSALAASLAASLAGVAFLGLWLQSAGQVSALRSQFATEQQARIRAEQQASAPVQVPAGPDQPAGPSVYIAQLQPLEEATRGDEELDKVTVGHERVVLFLPSVPDLHDDGTEAAYEVDLQAPGKGGILRLSQIKLQATGEYSFEVPMGFLQPGKTYDVQVYARKNGRREKLESYRFQAVASAGDAPRP